MITIVYGPQGCGKTRNKEKLLSELGRTHVIDQGEASESLQECISRAYQYPLPMILTNLSLQEIEEVLSESQNSRTFHLVDFNNVSLSK